MWQKKEKKKTEKKDLHLDGFLPVRLPLLVLAIFIATWSKAGPSEVLDRQDDERLLTDSLYPKLETSVIL